MRCKRTNSGRHSNVCFVPKADVAQSVSLVLYDFARTALVQLTHPNLLCYQTKRMLLISQEAERRENVVDAQPRSQVMDKAHFAERFFRMSGGCEYESGDR